VTAPLGSGGVLWITYVGQVGGATADVIFDVTGYFEPEEVSSGNHSSRHSLAPLARNGGAAGVRV
jgi:hypothetical protein